MPGVIWYTITTGKGKARAMDERQEEMNIREFEYLLREQKAFLEKLLEKGVGDEAGKEIETRLKVINETLAQ